MASIESWRRAQAPTHEGDTHVHDPRQIPARAGQPARVAPPGARPGPQRPPAGEASALAFLRFETPDLDAAERFQRDFGMQTVQRSAERLVMRGAGTAPPHLRRNAPTGRATSARRSRSRRAPTSRAWSATPARPLDQSLIPGGGRGVELIDPAGHALWLLADRPRSRRCRTRAPLWRPPTR